MGRGKIVGDAGADMSAGILGGPLYFEFAIPESYFFEAKGASDEKQNR